MKEDFDKYEKCFPKNTWTECKWYVRGERHNGECKYVIWTKEYEDGREIRYCKAELFSLRIKAEAQHQADEINEAINDLFDL